MSRKIFNETLNVVAIASGDRAKRVFQQGIKSGSLLSTVGADFTTVSVQDVDGKQEVGVLNVTEINKWNLHNLTRSNTLAANAFVYFDDESDELDKSDSKFNSVRAIAERNNLPQVEKDKLLPRAVIRVGTVNKENEVAVRFYLPKVKNSEDTLIKSENLPIYIEKLSAIVCQDHVNFEKKEQKINNMKAAPEVIKIEKAKNFNQYIAALREGFARITKMMSGIFRRDHSHDSGMFHTEEKDKIEKVQEKRKDPAPV